MATKMLTVIELQANYEMLKKQVDYIFKAINKLEDVQQTIDSAATINEEWKSFKQQIVDNINENSGGMRLQIEKINEDIMKMKKDIFNLSRRKPEKYNSNSNRSNSNSNYNSNASVATDPGRSGVADPRNYARGSLVPKNMGGKRNTRRYKTRNARKTPKRKSRKTTRRR